MSALTERCGVPTVPSLLISCCFFGLTCFWNLCSSCELWLWFSWPRVPTSCIAVSQVLLGKAKACAVARNARRERGQTEGYLKRVFHKIFSLLYIYGGYIYIYIYMYVSFIFFNQNIMCQYREAFTSYLCRCCPAIGQLSGRAPGREGPPSKQRAKHPTNPHKKIPSEVIIQDDYLTKNLKMTNQLRNRIVFFKVFPAWLPYLCRVLIVIRCMLFCIH